MSRQLLGRSLASLPSEARGSGGPTDTRAPLAVAVAFGMACVALFPAVGCARTSCRVDADCVDSDEARDLGRCAPQDAVCTAGACSVRCTRPCTVERADTNPCPDGLICNQSATRRPDQGWATYCTRGLVRCQTPADCPTYLPGDGAWSCDAGTCRFPGFTYGLAP